MLNFWLCPRAPSESEAPGGAAKSQEGTGLPIVLLLLVPQTGTGPLLLFAAPFQWALSYVRGDSHTKRCAFHKFLRYLILKS